MYKFAPGFIAKASLRSTPLVGGISDCLESIWLDRTNSQSREYVVNELKKRQQDFLAGKKLTPIMVFPEGTTTSGHHIIQLKRGAFELLQPLKSIVVKTLTPGNDLAEGITPMPLKALRTFSSFSHIIKVVELPVIYPTEYMYENYKKINPNITNKAEVYAEVTRELWCEIGGFKKGTKGFKDYLEYLSIIEGKKIHNT